MAVPWSHSRSTSVKEGKLTKESGDEKAKLGFAFFWLTGFYFVYCARPTDLIPGFGHVHPAKIAAALAILSLLFGIQSSVRKPKDLPKEAFYLSLLTILLFVSAVFSPVWRGGAFNSALEFSKAWLAWMATFLLVTSFRALRRIVFIQSASVALVALYAIVKGHSVPRLQDVVGGIYGNPNDMAMAIVLSIPFCLAFLISARSLLRKAAWLLAIVIMTSALLLTASRAGFIELGISGMVLLWHFGVKGKRTYLIVGAMVLMAGSFMVAGHQLALRWAGFFGGGQTEEQDVARTSYVQRRELVTRAIETIADYPILGVGAGNFPVLSGNWHHVHVAYLQIAVEGGIPALILYVMFLARGFVNLRVLFKAKNLDAETVLFLGAMKSALVGFVVGACFAPVAYSYFPYFFVCYTSALVATFAERERSQGAVGETVDFLWSRKGSLSMRRPNGLIHTR